jgi:hypothetical protein
MANEMRDRLVELIYEGRKEWDVYFNDYLLKGKPRSKTLNEFIAVHLIESGVVVPPCKVGQRVYAIYLNGKLRTPLQSDRITQITINRGGYHFKCWWGYFHLSDIGKTVFLTKAEAEQKLKELRGAE